MHLPRMFFRQTMSDYLHLRDLAKCARISRWLEQEASRAGLHKVHKLRRLFKCIHERWLRVGPLKQAETLMVRCMARVAVALWLSSADRGRVVLSSHIAMHAAATVFAACAWASIPILARVHSAWEGDLARLVFCTQQALSLNTSGNPTFLVPYRQSTKLASGQARRLHSCVTLVATDDPTRAQVAFAAYPDDRHVTVFDTEEDDGDAVCAMLCQLVT